MAATLGALTKVTGSSVVAEKMPCSIERQTSTLRAASSPRTSTVTEASTAALITPTMTPSLTGQLQPGRDLLVDGTAGDIDRVGDEVAGQRQAHTLGDVGAGAVLRLGVGGTQVRVTTTWSSSNNGESVHGSVLNTSRPAPRT